MRLCVHRGFSLRCILLTSSMHAATPDGAPITQRHHTAPACMSAESRSSHGLRSQSVQSRVDRSLDRAVPPPQATTLITTNPHRSRAGMDGPANACAERLMQPLVRSSPRSPSVTATLQQQRIQLTHRYNISASTTSLPPAARARATRPYIRMASRRALPQGLEGAMPWNDAPT